MRQAARTHVETGALACPAERSSAQPRHSSEFSPEPAQSPESQSW
jgi:hypothetical protein